MISAYDVIFIAYINIESRHFKGDCSKKYNDSK